LDKQPCRFLEVQPVTLVPVLTRKLHQIFHCVIYLSHLQYADDTLCIGVPTVENLWTLKTILRGFETTSRLKVNFHKNSLIGVNLPRDFMEAACGFLHCREGSNGMGNLVYVFYFLRIIFMNFHEYVVGLFYEIF